MSHHTSLHAALQRWVVSTCPLFISTLVHHFQWSPQLSSDISNLVASKLQLEPIDISLSKQKDCKSVFYYSPAFMSIASECFHNVMANLQDTALPSLSIINQSNPAENSPLTVNILMTLLNSNHEASLAPLTKGLTRPALAEFLACIFSACLNTYLETTPVFHIYLPFLPENTDQGQSQLDARPYIKCSRNEIMAMFSNKGYLNIAFIENAREAEASFVSSFLTIPKVTFLRLVSSLQSVDLATHNYLKQLKSIAKSDSTSNRQRGKPTTYNIVRNRRSLLLSLETIFANFLPALGSIAPLPWQESDVSGKPSCPEVCVTFFPQNECQNDKKNQENVLNKQHINSARLDVTSSLPPPSSSPVFSAASFSSKPRVLGRKCDSELSQFCALERFERSIETALASSTDLGFSSSTLNPSSIPYLAFSPVAFFRSCFREKFGTPRQGSFCAHSRGELVLRSDIDSDAFDGLEQFSHVWIVFVFHANNPEHPLIEDMMGGFKEAKGGVKRCHNEIEYDSHSVSQVRIVNATERTNSISGVGCAPISNQTKVRAKVRPPKMGGQKTGFFASRSPHRFNPIGLTVAKVRSIQGNKLLLSGCDLIDGTPILDIKPYHPADSIPLGHIFVPPWVMDGFEKNKDPSMYPTHVTELGTFDKSLGIFDKKLALIPIPIADLNPMIQQALPKERDQAIEEKEKEKEKIRNLDIDPRFESHLVRNNLFKRPKFIEEQNHSTNIAGNTTNNDATNTSSMITTSMSSDVFLYLHSLFLSDEEKLKHDQEKRKNTNLLSQPIFDFFRPEQKEQIRVAFNTLEKVGADLRALPSVLLPHCTSSLPVSLSHSFIDFLECVGEVQRADPRSLYSRKHHGYGSIFGVVLDAIQLTYVLMNPTKNNKNDDCEHLHLHLFHAQLIKSKHKSVAECEKPVFTSSLGFKTHQIDKGFVSEEIRSSTWVNAVKTLYPDLTCSSVSIETVNREQVVQLEK